MSEIVYFVIHVALDFLMPTVIVIGCIISLLGGILAIRFCYYYYLVHGDILWRMAEDDQRMADLVTKTYGVKPQVGILDAFIILGLTMAAGIVASLVWPATLMLLILTLPIGLYRIFFREQHKKVKFNLTLKGVYDRF